MGLYLYTVAINNAPGKNGKTTAKSPDAARTQIKKQFPTGSLVALEEIPPAPVTTPDHNHEKSLPPRPKRPVSKLERILFLQSGKCFFCRENLPVAIASIEHLSPKSKGGNNSDANIVACCQTLNQMFGDMPLREKFRFVLDQEGKLTCPRASLTPLPRGQTASESIENLAPEHSTTGSEKPG